jgi:hypothetical protein
MTAPDTDDIIPPRDPADFGRRRGRGVTIAAVSALVVISVALGFGAGEFADRMGGPKAAPAPAPAFTAPPTMDPAPLAAPSLPLAGAPSDPPVTSSGLQDLEARVAGLEDGQRRTLSAAGAALAAAALGEAAQTSRPFTAELAALEQVMPLSPDVRALRPLAETGAPSRAALAAEFSAAAARASVEARAPGEGANFGDRILHALSRVVTVRRVGSTTGNSPDAILARAERQAAEGDLAGALNTLRALPPRAADAMGAWRIRAEQRVALDRHLANIRAQALADLAAAREARP